MDDLRNRLLLVEIMAIDLMEKHKVDYLKFSFSNDKSILGYCSLDVISINKNHALFDDIDEVINTILHEIAHALAGNENNHNVFWKDIAIEIGVKLDEERYK